MKYAWHAPAGKPREPLRTLKELAEEFGVSQNELCGLMASHERWHDIKAPVAAVRSGRGYCQSLRPQRYYKPSEMRAWWKKIQERKCQEPVSS